MQSSTLACLSVVFFILALGMVLSALSGWYRLIRHFPDTEEKSLLTLNFISGRVGFVRLNYRLHLICCASGLRVEVFRALGPLSKAFLVPWSQITVVRDTSHLGEVAILKFGKPTIGSLMIPGAVANQITQRMQLSWPVVTPGHKGHIERLRLRLIYYLEVIIFWLVSSTLALLVFALGNLFVTDTLDTRTAVAEFAVAGIAGFVAVLRRYSRRK